MEGTGLGLSLVREFARALGGDVGATSTANEGSIFTVEVPFEHIGSETLEGGERTAPHERPIPSSDTQLDTRNGRRFFRRPSTRARPTARARRRGQPRHASVPRSRPCARLRGARGPRWECRAGLTADVPPQSRS